MESILIGGNISGFYAVSGAKDIEIGGNASNSGGVTSTNGAVTIKKNVANSGPVTAANNVTIEGNAENPKIGIISKNESVSIGGHASGYGKITAEKHIDIKGNASNSGGMVANCVSIEGDIKDKCSVDASSDITIKGNKLSSGTIISKTGDITILGTAVSSSGEIKTNGKVIIPNAKKSEENTFSSRRDYFSLFANKSSSSSSPSGCMGHTLTDDFDCYADGIIMQQNECLTVSGASKINVTNKFHDDLKIDNKGNFTLKMHAGVIEGLISDAVVICNNEKLKPVNGKITVDGFVPKNSNQSVNFDFF